MSRNGLPFAKAAGRFVVDFILPSERDASAKKPREVENNNAKAQRTSVADDGFADGFGGCDGRDVCHRRGK